MSIRQMPLHRKAGLLQRGMVLAAILALLLVLAACGGSAEETTDSNDSETRAPAPTATEAPQVEPTPTVEAEEEPASGESTDIAGHLSEKTMRLWDVYNMYDPDALAVFYSEDYWQEEVEEIRTNMEPFRNLNLAITAEETSPPTEIAPGRWEVRHTARFQGGLIYMVFIYEEFGEEWRLTYAKPE